MGEVHQIDQGTDAWHNARLGKATASKVADIVARTKSGYSASRANYAAQLICERLTGQRTETFTNAAMQWGIDTEAEARDTYAFLHAVQVEQVGFVDHADIPAAGASPDGLIGSDGLLEIKCPNSAQHIETLLNDAVADRYIVQMQWQMACTGRRWCNFVSYDPRLPESMRLYVKRIVRDDERIAELEAEVAKFLAEIDAKVGGLRARYERANDDAWRTCPLRAG